MSYVFSLAFALVTAAVLAGGCATDESGADAFVGSYQTTITISGSGSQTFTDSLTISEGATSDLTLQSQQLGALKASIIGASSFSIDQQSITLTDANGASFAVTIQGQGTATDGVLSANGTMTSPSGALSFTIAGSLL